MEASEITGLAVLAVGWTLVTIGSCDNSCAPTLLDPSADDLLGSLGDTERPDTADEMAPKLRHPFPAIAFPRASLRGDGGKPLRRSQNKTLGDKHKTHRDVLCERN